MNTITFETEADVLEHYRAKMGMEKVPFAQALGMRRREYELVLSGQVEQDVEDLTESAIKHVDDWIGDLAVRRLKVRGAIVPCVCITSPGDNGHCPEHGLICDGGEGMSS